MEMSCLTLRTLAETTVKTTLNEEVIVPKYKPNTVQILSHNGKLLQRSIK